MRKKKLLNELRLFEGREESGSLSPKYWIKRIDVKVELEKTILLKEISWRHKL